MSGKKKIKVWLPVMQAGSGVDVFTKRLATALTQRGFACEITWFALRYEFMPFLLRHVPPPADTDIVFANSWNAFAFKRPDIPLVTTLHHAEFDTHGEYLSRAQYLYRRTLIRRYELRSFQQADVITAVSQYAADTLSKTAFTHKLEVIHNWIDTNKFSPLASTASPQPFRLLFVGKPNFLKGYDLLPAIMEKLGRNFHLAIAGRVTPPNQATAQTNMTALGWLDESALIDAYRHCDALLFPSRSEGFGYTALEAMACGKPVIASNTTALPEIVDPGRCGILCRPGDVNGFVAACHTLAANPSQVMAMGEAARQKAVKDFSEDAIIGKYVDLINRLIKRDR